MEEIKEKSDEVFVQDTFNEDDMSVLYDDNDNPIVEETEEEIQNADKND